jgi:hypothetical protein
MGGGKLACELCRHLYMVEKVNSTFMVFELANRKNITVIMSLFVVVCGCKKDEDGPSNPTPVNYNLISWSVNSTPDQTTNYNVAKNLSVHLRFGAAINRSTATANVILKENNGSVVSSNISYADADSVIVMQPVSPLKYLSKYKVSIGNQLKSTNGGNLVNPTEISLTTTIDSSRKFPVISEDALLDSVQKRTFKFFWDLAHPTSGLARERNTDANTYTTGGTGFGIMAIVAAVQRNFISRAEGLARLQAMVSFLKNTAETFHGAYPHWLNGTTGKTIPFSINDDGADLVETSYLVQGLFTARQYFNGAVAGETDFRNDINTIVNRVEWDWFRKNNEDVLYWHWSAINSNGWIMNMQIKGWNESLISYVLAASSASHAVPKIAYDNGWASNGGMKNGKSYYGYQLPLGPEFGGPLFFSHYSFLGINPGSLTDSYANYEIQTKNHTLINYEYCKANPNKYFGYSDSTWGLTASDIPNGYNANSPTNDIGVITPTAAISSLPYTPAESMKALKFFYYVLGDKIWKEYGFADAFSLKDVWFADSFLAIDQGPIIVMIENYRSGLLWDLFTSCPEVKAGMKTLGFSAPYL